MILKKQENENEVRGLYKSSNICGSIYDKKTGDLTVLFNNGGQYKYPKVSLTDYTRFELAESQGVVFNSHIKKYPFEKMEKVDVSQLLNEVSELLPKDDENI
jgi:hypothetical protein